MPLSSNRLKRRAEIQLFKPTTVRCLPSRGLYKSNVVVITLADEERICVNFASLDANLGGAF